MEFGNRPVIKFVITLLLIMHSLASPASAKVILVDVDADGANNGSSWADAFDNLQDALAAALSGDVIRVARGVYKPDRGVGINSGNRNSTFTLRNGVVIRGGYAGYGEPDPDARDFINHPSILSGDLLDNDKPLENLQWQTIHDYLTDPARDDNCRTILTGRGISAGSILDGFTITGGHIATEQVLSSPASTGAGLMLTDSAVTIINCTFVRNSIFASSESSARGAAVYISGGSPVLENCTFVENIVFGGNVRAIGGAVFQLDSEPEFNACTFERNIATGYDSAYYGGALANCGGNAKITASSFAANSSLFAGGAIYNCQDANVAVVDCSFSENACESAGAAVFASSESQGAARTVFDNCSFARNTAYTGGAAVYSFMIDLSIRNCTFEENHANHQGGAVWIEGDAVPCTIIASRFTSNSAGQAGGALSAVNASVSLKDSSFTENAAMLAGAVFSGNTNLTVDKCSFESNEADSIGGAAVMGAETARYTDCVFRSNTAYLGGGLWSGNEAELTLTRCLFDLNHAVDDGGAVSIAESGRKLLADNSLFVRNTAGASGGAIYTRASQQSFYNCTFSRNTADRAAAVNAFAGQASMINCIVWANSDPMGNSQVSQLAFGQTPTVNYCCIQNLPGDLGGAGNIDRDPAFVSAQFNEFRLERESPCINTGANHAVDPGQMDLDGRQRVVRSIVDMGAYEFQGPFAWYVDGRNGSDSGSGWTQSTALRTIQRAVNRAERGDTVFVLPALYDQDVRFMGKAVKLQGLAVAGEIAVIQNTNDFAVSFYHGEGPDSIVSNFVIRNSLAGVFAAGSTPVVRNVTFVGNTYGVAAYVGATVSVSNCIFYQSEETDLYECTATYSCMSRESQGDGNIFGDPLFADPGGGDYHLLSERGRYEASTQQWVLDVATSPCIDAAEPFMDPQKEPMPNGARINMGAFGDTPFASMSQWRIEGDADYDGRVNMKDLAIILENWSTAASPNLRQ